MKIALLTKGYNQITKASQGGSPSFIYNYIDEIRKRQGIDVDIFASGESRLPIPVKSIFHNSILNDPILSKNPKLFSLALISYAFSQSKNYDLYHAHIDVGHDVLHFAPFIKKPIIITMHGNLNKDYLKKYFKLVNKYKNYSFISISNAQRKPIPDLPYNRTIHHGINTSFYEYSNDSDNYIIWVGRGIRQKGPHVIIEIIKNINYSTKLYASVNSRYKEWFNLNVKQKVKSYNLNSHITIVQNQPHSILREKYKKAKLLIYPIQWEEPFGLVMIESMACGTPVVAYSRGSVPEIVKDGETGFLVNPSRTNMRGKYIIKKTGQQGLEEAIKRIYSMTQSEYTDMRKRCRKHVEDNFMIGRMVDQYIEVYKQAISR